jgi:ScaI restriction endonuclease
VPSPYQDIPQGQWKAVTQRLVAEHPLSAEVIRSVALECWTSIFKSTFGHKGFRIGKDIFPKPQIMGFLLHELIPLELAARYPDVWRGDLSSADKDIVYVPDRKYSIEVKTSSHPNQIFGNRSYAQPGVSESKKAKSGYYLAVNFESCTASNPAPALSRVQFGWVDSSDWIGQRAATGQQSRLPTEVYAHKFVRIYG